MSLLPLLVAEVAVLTRFLVSAERTDSKDIFSHGLGPNTISLTVGTFNVLSQMRFVKGPTGFPLVTEETVELHQPSQTADQQKQLAISPASNTWIQQMLKELMVNEAGPQIELMVLQEIDFPMFFGIQEFLDKTPGFKLAPLQQSNSLEANATHQKWREDYINGKVTSHEVPDFPYLVYKTSKVERMECKPVQAYNGTGVCDFALQGASVEYKGMFMHASSTGLSAKTPLQRLSNGATLDLFMGDCNTNRAGIDASNGQMLEVLEAEGSDGPNFGTVQRHVYRLRKVAQVAQNTKNFKAVRTARGSETLSCRDLKEFCGCTEDQDWELGSDDSICNKTQGDEALTKACKYGSKVCSAYQSKPTSDKEAEEIKSFESLESEIVDGSLDMAHLSGKLGYGPDDWAMEKPTFAVEDMGKFVKYERKQEDWILVAPRHLQSLAPKAHVYKLNDVLEQRAGLEDEGYGLPGFVLPSDHLPLFATVHFHHSAR